jgi:amino acid adenylation domain-containing protein
VRPALLQEYVATTAAQRGEAIAVAMGDERLTYSELEALSNQLADALVEAGCRPGDRVCLLAPKAPATIAAMLGVLKAGCAYVPVDTSAPPARTARMLRLAEPAAAFAMPEAEALLAELRRCSALPDALSAITPADAAGRPDRPHRVLQAPSDPAHILFTSGSTGDPKGVVVTHASVTAFVDWAVPYFGIAAGDRLSGLPPLHFDLSTFDVYAAMRAGAELHLVPPGTILPGQLAQYIERSEVVQLFCVPSMLAYILGHGALPEDGFPALRRILWCGEVLLTSVLREWMARHPRATFTNLYGPTEATIASSYHAVDSMPDERTPIPIGTACAGEELFVISDDGKPLPDGELGELCIAGVGLSPGYWRNPDATALAFVCDPRPGRVGERVYRTGDLARRDPAGTFHFLGRRDTQIKSRGYRIELGEIERAVGALPAIAECAVVAIGTNRFEGVTICCAIAVSNGDQPLPAALRSQLRDVLPAYMLPGRWKLLDSLPKNGSGKIDRRAVEHLFAGATGSELSR